MISAMPAVAVRRERKKQRAAAASRQGSLSSLPSPSTRSSSLLSSPLSAPPGYNYFVAQRRVSSASAPPGPPSRRPSGVSTISSAASNYVSALHRVRERQLETQRERARFLVYTGSVLAASGAALIAIGLWARATAAQTVGLLFLALGAAFYLARVFCLVQQPPPPPLLKRVSGHSLYAPSAHHSTATTPGTDDSASSYYFAPPPPRPTAATSPTTAAALPPLQPPPPPVAPAGVHGSHRSNPILTPMSLNSIPEMQVLITDDSQRY